MPGNVRDVAVRLRLDNSGYTDKLKKTEAETKSFGSKFGSFASAAMPPWLRVTAVVAGVGAAIRSAVRDIDEWQLAQARMTLVAQGNVDVLSKMESIVDANSGGLFNKQSVAAAVSYGLSLGVAVERVAELMPYARGLAAINNEELAPSFEKIIRAVEIGNAKAGLSIGLRFDENNLERESIRLYGDHYKKLDDLLQLEVRYSIAKTQLVSSLGGEAAALATTGGAMKKFGKELGHLAVTAIEPFVDAGTSVVKELTDAIIQARLYLEPGKGDIGTSANRAQQQQALRDAYMAGRAGVSSGSVQSPTGVLSIGGYTRTGYEAARAYEAEHAAEIDARKKAEEAFQTWRNSKLEEIELKNIEAAYQARLDYERIRGVGGGAEPTLAGGGYGMQMGPPAPGTYTGPAIAVTATDLTSEQAAYQKAMQDQTELEQLNLGLREEAWKNYGAVIESSYGGAIDSVSFVLGRYMNREIQSHKQAVAIWKWAGKNMLASFMDYVSEKYKMRAMEEGAEALSAAAHGNFASAAAHLASAAKFGLIAGVSGGAASAMAAGANRELAALNYQTEPAAGDITRTSSGGTSTSSSRDLAATISRAPETVNINVTNIIENPTFFGTDQASLRSLFDENIAPWVQDSLRTGEIAA